jgi:hypothetical protein
MISFLPKTFLRHVFYVPCNPVQRSGAPKRPSPYCRIRDARRSWLQQNDKSPALPGVRPADRRVRHPGRLQRRYGARSDAAAALRATSAQDDDLTSRHGRNDPEMASRRPQRPTPPGWRRLSGQPENAPAKPNK